MLCVLCDHYCFNVSIKNAAMKQQQWIKHRLVDPVTFLLVKCVSRNKYISLWNDNTSCLYSLNSIKICKTIKRLLYNFDKVILVSFIDLRLHVIPLYHQSYFLITCTYTTHCFAKGHSFLRWCFCFITVLRVFFLVSLFFIVCVFFFECVCVCFIFFFIIFFFLLRLKKDLILYCAFA